MNIFDIIGPVMIGPSSSHTAGACRIGYAAGILLGEPLKSAQILMYGSFLTTGPGHGTPQAIVAGLLGMKPDDQNLVHSLELAWKQGLEISFGECHLPDAHPNTAQLFLTGIHGAHLEITAQSIGGGKINIAQIDGIDTNFSGELPTLVVHNMDKPGHVGKVTTLLSEHHINIAAMQLYRASRGGMAVMVLECDQRIPDEIISIIAGIDGVVKATYFNGLEQ